MSKRSLISSLFAISVAFAADSSQPAIHVNNLGHVNEHLWRGAEPSGSAIAELSSAGVKVVIDLRESGSATQFEREAAEKLRINYSNVPFPPLSAPSATQVNAVLKIIAEHNNETVFVHCRRGKDRTGTVVACYRIQHDGWSNQRALDEAKQYGMSAAERGMRSFVLHFTPTLQPTMLSAKPLMP